MCDIHTLKDAYQKAALEKAKNSWRKPNSVATANYSQGRETSAKDCMKNNPFNRPAQQKIESRSSKDGQSTPKDTLCNYCKHKDKTRPHYTSDGLP